MSSHNLRIAQSDTGSTTFREVGDGDRTNEIKRHFLLGEKL